MSAISFLLLVFSITFVITSGFLSQSTVLPSSLRHGTCLLSFPHEIWSKDTLITDLFDKKFLLYLKKFYDNNCQEDGVSYSTFAEWRDIHEMLNTEEVDTACLKQVWAEALLERGDVKGNGVVSFDTFVRVNARLEEIIEDMSSAQKAGNRELDAFHRQMFFESTHGEPVMAFGQFLSCSPIQSLLERELLSQLQLERMWRALPKEPLGSYFASEDRVELGDGASFTRRASRQADGIRVEAFQSLMSEILDSLLSETGGEDTLFA